MSEKIACYIYLKIAKFIFDFKQLMKGFVYNSETKKKPHFQNIRQCQVLILKDYEFLLL